MKSDLDRYMEESDLDALLVMGPAGHNPAMTYFTGLVHLTHAFLVKKRGRPPVLFAGSMEREEAARTGLETRSLAAYPWPDLMREAGGDAAQAQALRLQRMLQDCGVSGRVAVYGRVEVGPAYGILERLRDLAPDLTLLGEVDQSVVTRARATKDAAEVARIRSVGERTVAVVARVAEFLTSRPVKEGILQDGDGPLTVGAVKRRINLWLTKAGLDNPEGTIFALGHDAGVPHSAGQAADPVRVGVPIVFDIFPCEAGGGYYFDFTRTWCLGEAPAAVEKAYRDVRRVFEEVRQSLAAGGPCRDYQNMVCDRFEALGHPTLRSDPATERGYVHSLGHGLGLAIHERPSFSHLENNQDRLEPGTVFTFEPGLYYPDQDLGVRLEDTLWVTPEGQIETLVEYPLDLVLPMRG